jgi:hypothetical protein
MALGPGGPDAPCRLEPQPPAMHRAPHASIAGQDANRDEDVPGDDHRERDRREPVDERQDRERRTDVDEDETDAGADQDREQADDRDVRQPLARVEVTLVAAEAAADDAGRPPEQPASVAAVVAERLAHEADDAAGRE